MQGREGLMYSDQSFKLDKDKILKPKLFVLTLEISDISDSTSSFLEKLKLFIVYISLCSNSTRETTRR